MTKNVSKIKNIIKEECEKAGKSWFYNVHLLGVEKFAKALLRKLPRADEEAVMLGVWLHDLQRIRRLKGDHAKIGAREAVKVMKSFGYEENILNHVKDMILSHCCDNSNMPKTLEAKILSSADAMSHYTNDFYLHIAVLGERDLREYKKWALEKLERNYNKKIKFNFAKKMIKERHDIFKKIFTMM